MDASLMATRRASAYRLAVASVFQNEAPFLREWLEFHKMMGVELFVLIDDRSTDHFEEVLRPYVRSGVVVLLSHPCPEEMQGREWIGYQQSVLDELCQQFRGVVDWLALIDVDEFIVPASSCTVTEFLATCSADTGAVYVHWVPFGTSNIESLPPNLLMTEVLCRRRRFVRGHETLGKSIIRPQSVAKVDIHRCDLSPGATYLDCNPGMQSRSPPLKLHHYWSRSREFLMGQKLPRLARIKGWDMNGASVAGYLALFNDVVDHTMKRYASELRKRVFDTKGG